MRSLISTAKVTAWARYWLILVKRKAAVLALAKASKATADKSMATSTSMSMKPRCFGIMNCNW